MQAEAVAKVRAAREKRDRTTRELNQAIRDAYETGALVKDIAAAADLTRQRVHQIVKG